MTEFVLFLVAIFVLYEASRRRSVQREHEAQLSLLRQLVAELESKLREMRREVPATREAQPGAAVPHERRPSAPEVVPIETAITHLQTEHKATQQPSHPTPPVAPPLPKQPEAARTAPPTPAPPPAPAFEPAILHTSAAQPKPARRSLSLEERLGTNWLSKLGAVLLVLGVVSFLIYEFGGTPGGKIFLGYACALLALGWGVWLDRNPNYKIFARSCIGGGWALLYFTTFAMNHVAAARVLSSEPLDLALMLLVAAGMVAHSLRYRAQAATALAFLLGFTAVAISHTDITGLAANAVLALALAVIAVRLSWFEMEFVGILAAYATHLLWLEPLVESRSRPIPGGDISVALLIGYWAIFRASYVLRKITTPQQESLSAGAALLNSFALLGLLKYQAAHPELAFWALLVFGALEIALGQLPMVRRRRTAFLVLTTIGATLVIAAFPFRYGGSTLAILWLFCSQALIFVGVLAREIHFRRLGEWAAVIAGATIFYQGYAASANPTAGLVFSMAALLFWIDAEFVPRRWPELIISDFEPLLLRLLSYFAAAMAAMAAWVALPDAWIPVAWAGLAALATAIAAPLELTDVQTQASLLVAAGLVDTLIAHSGYPTGLVFSRTLGIVSAVIVAAIAYGIAPWSRFLAAKTRPTITTGASLLVFVLIWRESNSAWVGVGWVAMALGLTIAARLFRYAELAVQAHAVASAAFVYAVLINLPSAAMYQHAQLRLVTAGAIAIVLYAIARLSRFDRVPWLKEIGPLHTWFATALIAALAWYELAAVAVVPAWTVLGVALLEAALIWRSPNLRLQSYCVLVAAFVRMWFVNLLAGDPVLLGMTPRMYTLIPLAAAFVYCYVRLTTGDQSHSATAGSPASRWSRLPELHGWLATATIAAVLRFEVPEPWVISAWAALALAVLAAAWAFHRRRFVYQALVLALAVVGRGAFYNIAERSNFAPGESTLLTTGVAAGILFCSLAVAFRLRAKAAQPSGQGMTFAIHKIVGRPEQLLFFAAVALVTLALGFCMESSGPLTVAWGIEGVALFIFALLVSERSYRLTGLVLLLVCVAKIVSFDIWGHRVSDRQRYLTLIIIGAALLLVSFLYNRNRDRVRQLL